MKKREPGGKLDCFFFFVVVFLLEPGGDMGCSW